MTERAVVLCTGDRIGPDLLPDSLRFPVQTDLPAMIVPADGLSLKDAVSRYERTMILQSLEMANGVQKRAPVRTAPRASSNGASPRRSIVGVADDWIACVQTTL